MRQVFEMEWNADPLTEVELYNILRGHFDSRRLSFPQELGLEVKEVTEECADGKRCHSNKKS
jgi:hypothetical protein